MLLPLLLNNLLTGTKKLWRQEWRVRKVVEEPLQRASLIPAIEPVEEPAEVAEIVTQILESQPVVQIVEQPDAGQMLRAAEIAISQAGTKSAVAEIQRQVAAQLQALAIEKRKKNNQIAIMLIMANA